MHRVTPKIYGFISAFIVAFASPALGQDEEDDTTPTPSATVAAGSTATPAPITTPDATPTAAQSDVLKSAGIPFGKELHSDKKDRAPLLALTAEYVAATKSAKAHGKISVDATVNNEEFNQYPIRFDFYINRKLIETQYRSPQLPGVVGIDVPLQIAAPPFNYVVVATVLHPNRSFSSLIEGAVFATQLARSFTCQFTVGEISSHTDLKDKVYEASVSASQVSETAIGLAFESSKLVSGGDSKQVGVAGDLSLAGETASGSLTTTVGGDSTTASVTGTVTRSADSVTGFEVMDEASGTKLSCN